MHDTAETTPPLENQRQAILKSPRQMPALQASTLMGPDVSFLIVFQSCRSRRRMLILVEKMVRAELKEPGARKPFAAVQQSLEG